MRYARLILMLALLPTLVHAQPFTVPGGGTTGTGSTTVNPTSFSGKTIEPTAQSGQHVLVRNLAGQVTLLDVGQLLGGSGTQVFYTSYAALPTTLVADDIFIAADPNDGNRNKLWRVPAAMNGSGKPGAFPGAPTFTSALDDPTVTGVSMMPTYADLSDPYDTTEWFVEAGKLYQVTTGGGTKTSFAADIANFTPVGGTNSVLVRDSTGAGPISDESTELRFDETVFQLSTPTANIAQIELLTRPQAVVGTLIAADATVDLPLISDLTARSWRRGECFVTSVTSPTVTGQTWTRDTYCAISDIALGAATAGDFAAPVRPTIPDLSVLPAVTLDPATDKVVVQDNSNTDAGSTVTPADLVQATLQSTPTGVIDPLTDEIYFTDANNANQLTRGPPYLENTFMANEVAINALGATLTAANDGMTRIARDTGITYIYNDAAGGFQAQSGVIAPTNIPDWQPNTFYFAGQEVIEPRNSDGSRYVFSRIADGTSAGSFDITEEGLWNIIAEQPVVLPILDTVSMTFRGYVSSFTVAQNVRFFDISGTEYSMDDWIVISDSRNIITPGSIVGARSFAPPVNSTRTVVIKYNGTLQLRGLSQVTVTFRSGAATTSMTNIRANYFNGSSQSQNFGGPIPNTFTFDINGTDDWDFFTSPVPSAVNFLSYTQLPNSVLAGTLFKETSPTTNLTTIYEAQSPGPTTKSGTFDATEEGNYDKVTGFTLTDFQLQISTLSQEVPALDDILAFGDASDTDNNKQAQLHVILAPAQTQWVADETAVNALVAGVPLTALDDGRMFGALDTNQQYRYDHGTTSMVAVGSTASGDNVYNTDGTIPGARNITVQGPLLFLTPSGNVFMFRDDFITLQSVDASAGTSSYTAGPTGHAFNFGPTSDFSFDGDSGTAGEVLTSQGNNLPPVWQPGGSGLYKGAYADISDPLVAGEVFIDTVQGTTTPHLYQVPTGQGGAAKGAGFAGVEATRYTQITSAGIRLRNQNGTGGLAGAVEIQFDDDFFEIVDNTNGNASLNFLPRPIQVVATTGTGTTEKPQITNVTTFDVDGAGPRVAGEWRKGEAFEVAADITINGRPLAINTYYANQDMATADINNFDPMVGVPNSDLIRHFDIWPTVVQSGLTSHASTVTPQGLVASEINGANGNASYQFVVDHNTVEIDIWIDKAGTTGTPSFGVNMGTGTVCLHEINMATGAVQIEPTSPCDPLITATVESVFDTGAAWRVQVKYLGPTVTSSTIEIFNALPAVVETLVYSFDVATSTTPGAAITLYSASSTIDEPRNITMQNNNAFSIDIDDAGGSPQAIFTLNPSVAGFQTLEGAAGRGGVFATGQGVELDFPNTGDLTIVRGQPNPGPEPGLPGQSLRSSGDNVPPYWGHYRWDDLTVNPAENEMFIEQSNTAPNEWTLYIVDATFTGAKGGAWDQTEEDRYVPVYSIPADQRVYTFDTLPSAVLLDQHFTALSTVTGNEELFKVTTAGTKPGTFDNAAETGGLFTRITNINPVGVAVRDEASGVLTGQQTEVQFHTDDFTITEPVAGQALVTSSRESLNVVAFYGTGRTVAGATDITGEATLAAGGVGPLRAGDAVLIYESAIVDSVTLAPGTYYAPSDGITLASDLVLLPSGDAVSSGGLVFDSGTFAHTGSTGFVPVTFNEPFPVVPVVQAIVSTIITGRPFAVIQKGSVTTTGFSYFLSNADGTGHTSTQTDVIWRARIPGPLYGSANPRASQMMNGETYTQERVWTGNQTILGTGSTNFTLDKTLDDPQITAIRLDYEAGNRRMIAWLRPVPATMASSIDFHGTAPILNPGTVYDSAWNIRAIRGPTDTNPLVIRISANVIGASSGSLVVTGVYFIRAIQQTMMLDASTNPGAATFIWDNVATAADPSKTAYTFTEQVNTSTAITLTGDTITVSEGAWVMSADIERISSSVTIALIEIEEDGAVVANTQTGDGSGGPTGGGSTSWVVDATASPKTYRVLGRRFGAAANVDGNVTFWPSNGAAMASMGGQFSEPGIAALNDVTTANPATDTLVIRRPGVPDIVEIAIDDLFTNAQQPLDIAGQTDAAIAGDDRVIFSDTSDSGNNKDTTAQDVANLAPNVYNSDGTIGAGQTRIINNEGTLLVTTPTGLALGAIQAESVFENNTGTANRSGFSVRSNGEVSLYINGTGGPFELNNDAGVAGDVFLNIGGNSNIGWGKIATDNLDAAFITSIADIEATPGANQYLLMQRADQTYARIEVSSLGITNNVLGCQTADCSNIDAPDGTRLDLSNVNLSDGTEGFHFPRTAATCPIATPGADQACWDGATFAIGPTVINSSAQTLEQAKTTGRQITSATSAATAVEIGSATNFFRLYDGPAGPTIDCIVGGADCDPKTNIKTGTTWRIQLDGVDGWTIDDTGASTLTGNMKRRKSIKFPGGMIMPDGTGCSTMTAPDVINGKPVRGSATCTDSPLSQLFIDFPLDEVWDKGPVQVAMRIIMMDGSVPSGNLVFNVGLSCDAPTGSNYGGSVGPLQTLTVPLAGLTPGTRSFGRTVDITPSGPCLQDYTMEMIATLNQGLTTVPAAQMPNVIIEWIQWSYLADKLSN